MKVRFRAIGLMKGQKVMLTLSTFHTVCDKGSLVCGVFGPAGSYLPRKLLNPGLKLILPTWLLQGSKITFYPCKIKIFHVCMALKKVRWQMQKRWRHYLLYSLLQLDYCQKGSICSVFSGWRRMWENVWAVSSGGETQLISDSFGSLHIR